MFFFVVPFRRVWLPLCLAALWLAAPPPCHAQTMVWSNPQGTATVFGSGAIATTLQTSATMAGIDASDSLDYLDASTLPAVSRSEPMKDDMAFASIAQLSVTETQTTGLPDVEGGINFESTNGGVGSGSGSISLYILINVPSPAMINLTGIRSIITTTGSPDSLFTMNLFQSDAAGGKFGSALLSYAGTYFDADGSYQSSAPFYLLETTVSANATPASLDTVEFSYFLDLAPVVSVPEPSSAALLIGGAIAGLAFVKARSRRRRRT